MFNKLFAIELTIWLHNYILEFKVEQPPLYALRITPILNISLYPKEQIKSGPGL